MSKRVYLSIFLASLFVYNLAFAFEKEGNAGRIMTPSPQLLSKLFGGKKFSQEESQKYRYIALDLDGDKRDELILYIKSEKGSVSSFLPKKEKKCLCDPPPPSPIEERYIRSFRKLKKYIWKFSLVPLKELKLKKKNRRKIRHNIEIWFNSKLLKSERKQLQYQYYICRKFRRYRLLERKYRPQKVYFFSNANSKGVVLTWKSCKYLGSKNLKIALRLFKRWAKSTTAPKLPLCDCPKDEEKKAVVDEKKDKPPFTVWLAAEIYSPKVKKVKNSGDLGGVELAGDSVEAQLIQKKWKLFRRWECENFEVVPLTLPPHNLALKIEEERKNPVDKSTERFVQFFMYFQGAEKPIKSVLKLQVLKEGDPENPEVRRWKEIQIKNLDSDAWLEIAVEHFFENAQFSGLIGKTLYKWDGFKFVELNSYRGIFRSVSSGSLVKRPRRSSPLSSKVIFARSSPNNAVDGFFDTAWFPRIPGLNSSLRIEWSRPVKLLGLAVVVKTPPPNFTPFIKEFWRQTLPKLKFPQYLQINVSRSKYYLNIPSDRDPAIGIVQFPQPVITQFIQLKLSDHYVDPQTGKRFSLSAKEFKGSAMFVSEVIPILEQNLYVASSILKTPGEIYFPSNAGDFRDKTAWAESKKGDGIGEWIQLILPKPRQISKLLVVNGCRKLGEKYTINNRIREAILHFSDGSSQTVTLKDTHKLQSITISPIKTKTIRLEIKSVYPGKLEKISCLSEFRVQ